jgi:uncharacterized integral membrane protein
MLLLLLLLLLLFIINMHSVLSAPCHLFCHQRVEQPF